ncbi:MAG: efflux RND transporter periplasmic adaptor subunit [Candidatus Omnitrophica bacterium]|nr:efflux RND transporter periplasmic adaptor subunit [Candidatus Omnitrophota bacterium]
MKRRLPFLVIVLAILAAGIYYVASRGARSIVLTGIVTADEVIVSSEMQGRLQQLRVREGDTVTEGELLGIIQPQEQEANVAFYSSSEKQSSSQVALAEADLRYQEAQTTNQIQQAEANLAAAQANLAQAEADSENARLTFEREASLYQQKIEPAQSYDLARTAYDSAKAHVESMRKQVQAAQVAVKLAKSNAEQNEARRAALQASLHQLAAAGAQMDKAKVQLNYTEIRSPMAGIVDTRAALEGEVVNPGQAILTLINPDQLWIRADVEESYIDRIRIGDQFNVRLPSGVERTGTVFFRGVDADFATQRDVSRTKRDIKTFEIRLRCDNRDRRLAVGMTAYVTLPLSQP